MRSRYTAYTRGDLVYLKKTSESPSGFDAAAAKKWANQVELRAIRGSSRLVSPNELEMFMSLIMGSGTYYVPEL